VELCSDDHSRELSADDLQPGDILCFDYGQYTPKIDPATHEAVKDPITGKAVYWWKGQDGTVDHVALYAGRNANGDGEVIEAVAGYADQVKDFPLAVVAARKAQGCGVDGKNSCPGTTALTKYARLKPRPGEPAIEVRSHSPIALRVTDPDGIAIDAGTEYRSGSETSIAIPGALYYMLVDGEHDTVYSPLLKQGPYRIEVLPKADAQPDATYGLVITVLGQSMSLAEGSLVSDIPRGGYGVLVEGSKIKRFVPVSIVVRPGERNPAPIDRKSHGVVPVAVLSSPQFDATALDPSRIYCGPNNAGEAHGKVHVEDLDGDGLADAVLHFRIDTLGLTTATMTLEFWGYTVDSTLARGVAAVLVR
jgi:hypothetical protein